MTEESSLKLEGPHSRVPYAIKKPVSRVMSSTFNVLPYVEAHLTDHCNLNCKGCSHYSPLCEETFADIGEFERDMRRLSELFRSVQRIRLMGGEPLLHPEVGRFVRVTHSIFPNSATKVITNGLLLPRVDASFWEACRECGVGIEITVYPPVAKQLDRLLALCASENVDVRPFSNDSFYVRMNDRGDSDPEKVFSGCRVGYWARFMRKGRLYPCSTAALNYIYNDAFGTHIEDAPGIDIHTATSGRKVLRQLREPTVSCAWCTLDRPSFDWGVSSRSAEEWVSTTYSEASE